MTFRHRRWHLVIWLAMTPTIAVGLIVSTAKRPTPRAEPAITTVHMNHPSSANAITADKVQP